MAFKTALQCLSSHLCVSYQFFSPLQTGVVRTQRMFTSPVWWHSLINATLVHIQVSLAQHVQIYYLANTCARVLCCALVHALWIIAEDADKSHKLFLSLVSFMPQGREFQEEKTWRLDFTERKRERASGLLPGLLSVTAGVVISTGSLCLCVVMCRHRELWESWVISTDEKQMAAEVQ